MKKKIKGYLVSLLHPIKPASDFQVFLLFPSLSLRIMLYAI